MILFVVNCFARASLRRGGPLSISNSVRGHRTSTSQLQVFVLYFPASIVSYSFVNSVIRPLFFVLLWHWLYASLGAIKATLCVVGWAGYHTHPIVFAHCCGLLYLYWIPLNTIKYQQIPSNTIATLNTRCYQSNPLCCQAIIRSRLYLHTVLWGSSICIRPSPSAFHCAALSVCLQQCLWAGHVSGLVKGWERANS